MIIDFGNKGSNTPVSGGTALTKTLTANGTYTYNSTLYKPVSITVDVAGSDCSEIQAQYDELEAQYAELEVEKDEAVSQKEQAESQRDTAISQKNQAVSEKNQAIADKNALQTQINSMGGLEVTENGTYTPTDTIGYTGVTVNVPTSSGSSSGSTTSEWPITGLRWQKAGDDLMRLWFSLSPTYLGYIDKADETEPVTGAKSLALISIFHLLRATGIVWIMEELLPENIWPQAEGEITYENNQHIQWIGFDDDGDRNQMTLNLDYSNELTYYAVWYDASGNAHEVLYEEL